jgi:hypothetical protein
MSFERHHPNRQVDRNLARARDLRSTYLLAWPAAIAQVMACRWRLRRGNPPSPELNMPVPQGGKQPV